ncbi:MAG: phosphoglucosamine mutase [Actinomycetes bacterium]|jgi:phosphoglucosamine mutase|nr:MAG: phosphoglucosamine mutase [Actinomycetota bacterium]
MSDLRRLLDEGKPIFGTDGVRGVAGSDLTPELALAIGRAAGGWLRTGPVLVGRDTRRSGSMLSEALQAGFHAAGIDTVDVGVMPSGGISYLTESTSATMGAVVSASHNPAGDNGIKLLAARGTKLPDSVERELEERLRSGAMTSAVGPAIGYRIEDGSGMAAYLDHLASSSRYSLSGISIALDCANGAAYKAAPELFDRLKADVIVHNAEPDGNNINAGCGATHPEFLASVAGGRIGLAFDGDADRLIAVDEDGNVANGDVIMAIVARHMKQQGRLKKDKVVATVMSNLGFRRSMDEAGIEIVETKVGDRYVAEAMEEHGAVLGGEQSGHVIFTEYARTGDGLLTAVQLLNVVAGTGKELRELRAGAITEYPQVLVNVEVGRARNLDDAPGLKARIAEVEAELGENGRVLVRPSGTEPLLRIMVEAPSESDARRYAEALAEAARHSFSQQVG